MAAPAFAPPETFVFGPFALDAYARTLSSYDQLVMLQPKTFELLLYFVRHPGRLLTKHELIEALWPGDEIGEGNLSQQIFLLRGALARCSPRASYVLTQPGRGYRFAEHVATQAEPASARDAEANRLYARGRYFAERRTAGALRRGIDYFQRAVDADAGFARAHAGLASAHALTGEYLLRAPADAFPAAARAARTALELDETSAEAHAVLGDVACFYERDFAAADRWYRRAHALAPQASQPTVFRGWFLCADARAGEAIALLDAALSHEPYSLMLQTTRAVASIFRRAFAEAVDDLRAVLEMDETYVHARYYLAMALHLSGRNAEALELCAGAVPDGYEQQLLALRGAAFARLGHPRGARAAAAAIRALGRRGRYVSAYNLACIALGLGEHDEALTALEDGLAERDPWLIFLPAHPQFDALRGEPRFRALVERARSGAR